MRRELSKHVQSFDDIVVSAKNLAGLLHAHTSKLLILSIPLWQFVTGQDRLCSFNDGHVFTPAPKPACEAEC